MRKGLWLRWLWIWLATLPGLAAAAPPNAVNYQGFLVDTLGQPRNGTVLLTARIWSHETDPAPGQLEYAETHTSVQVLDGVFQVALGRGSASVGSFDPGLFGKDRWLELVVDGETLAPRLPLRAVVGSLSCAVAATAEEASDASMLGGIAASGWQRAPTSACPPGSSIRAIASNGTVTCEPDDLGSGDVTSVTAGAGLSGGGSAGDVTLALADGGITTAKLADFSVNGDKVADDSLTATDIAPNSVFAQEIQSAAVEVGDFAFGAVTASHLAADSIGPGHVADATISGSKLAAQSVPSTKLDDEPMLGFGDTPCALCSDPGWFGVVDAGFTPPRVGFVLMRATVTGATFNSGIGEVTRCSLVTDQNSIDPASDVVAPIVADYQFPTNGHWRVTAHRTFAVDALPGVYKVLCNRNGSGRIHLEFYTTQY